MIDVGKLTEGETLALLIKVVSDLSVEQVADALNTTFDPEGLEDLAKLITPVYG